MRGTVLLRVSAPRVSDGQDEEAGRPVRDARHPRPIFAPPNTSRHAPRGEGAHRQHSLSPDWCGLTACLFKRCYGMSMRLTTNNSLTTRIPNGRSPGGVGRRALGARGRRALRPVLPVRRRHDLHELRAVEPGMILLDPRIVFLREGRDTDRGVWRVPAEERTSQRKPHLHVEVVGVGRAVGWRTVLPQLGEQAKLAHAPAPRQRHRA